MRKPSKKVLAALLFLSLTSSMSVWASDATKGLETHTYDSSGISYDAKTDRWYYESTNGYIHEWVSGDVFRNVAVDKVTKGIAQETKDRTASVSSESSSQKAADAFLQKSIDEISQNAIRYTDDTHSSISLSETGTTLSHLKDGTVAADSMDAITGGQLASSVHAISKETEDRKAAVSLEEKTRMDADDALSNRIGTLSGKETSYLSPDASLTGNLSSLDAAADTLTKDVASEKAASKEAIDAEISKRREEDAKISNAIGSASSLPTNYIKKNDSLYGKLSTLDQKVDPLKEKLEEEAKKNDYAFDAETQARKQADAALSDRLGEFDAVRETFYLDSSKDISRNLVLLDHENAALADAIMQERADRRQQMAGIKKRVGGCIDALSKKAHEMGADGAALAGVQFDAYEAGESKWSLGAGMGSHGSSNSTALGLSYHANENVSVNGAFTIGHSDTMWGLGLSVRPGSPSPTADLTPEMALLYDIDRLDRIAREDASAIEQALEDVKQGKER